ncbi:hypothetical protein [Calothrix sp. 336/3]|uniref:hypothetical protein n=1 Tax=Calothrix sp. 336/3 TaxID=1337936 RepID=UPI0004E2A2DA|nr:hypothetical protein [Calothrix sp. 336/3]AKG20392.1 integral membrane protein [Calothrix sp. 336/3]
MKRLTVKQRNWLLSFHIAFGGIWLGTALCMVLLAWNNRYTSNGDELYTINRILKLLDDFVIIPAANLSLLTGGLLCWLTAWGFFKHYWVITKWVATITLITVGTIWLGPWVNAMTAISATDRIKALQNPLYVFDNQGVFYGGMVQTAFVLAIVVISVVKPWGKRKVKQEEQKPATVSES